MASVFLSVSSAPIVCSVPKIQTSSSRLDGLSSIGGGLRRVPKIQISNGRRRVARLCKKTTISGCIVEEGEGETLKTVQRIIAKQLSIEETTVAAATKFSDLGADSLDTVEIMMALEEKFGVSIGEGGAENISTVQDAADLIHKVKASASSSSSA